MRKAPTTMGAPEGSAIDSSYGTPLKRPFYFSDAEGDSTLEGFDLDAYSDNPEALTGKVV